MKYKRDKQGHLCYTDNEGRITKRVPEEKPDKDRFMFSVDDEYDDAWEDRSGLDGPWTE